MLTSAGPFAQVRGLVVRRFIRTFGWFFGELLWYWYMELVQVQNNPVPSIVPSMCPMMLANSSASETGKVVLMFQPH